MRLARTRLGDWWRGVTGAPNDVPVVSASQDSRKDQIMQDAGPAQATGEGRREEIPLAVQPLEEALAVTVFRYGQAGARPKAYLQAGLHADEFPGMLALRHLREMLDEAERQDRVLGEIVLVPQANPIGLRQQVGGFLLGRFDTQTGSNFNRDYPDLAAAIGDGLEGALGADPAANTATIRGAMEKALVGLPAPDSPVASLRQILMRLAHDADFVFDLHADNQALRHVYVGTPLWPDALDLASEIDARAVLLAEVSGGNPFDEACSGPWWALAQRYPDVPIPPACLAATLELGSNDDVDMQAAKDQAAALYRVLERRGVVAGPSDSRLPELRCEATALTAMEQVKAPVSGLVAYRLRLGDRVRAGDVVATIIDPLGEAVDVLAETDGLLFARHSQTYAWPGKVIGKIAGKSPLPSRQGKLLTD
jgi:predicted deacylase